MIHIAAYLTVFATALSASAFSVTAPNNSSGWSSTGSNTLAWQRVSTDATNFTVFLSNTDRTVLPTNNLLLVAFVDATSATSVAIDAPSGGFNVGGTYRVNLAKSADEPSTIYAQSEEFDITAGSSSATDSTASSGSTTSSGGSATRTSLTLSSTGTDGSASGTSTGSDSNPSQTGNAASNQKAEFGLLAAMLMIMASILA